MSTKVYKVELMVIDHQGMGEEGIVVELENCRYVYPSVMNIESRDIGEWDDEHPLNKFATSAAEFQRLFSSPE